MKKCLCYTEEKGLFVDHLICDIEPIGCLFVEKDDLHRRTYTIEVPKQDFVIRIHVKLGNYRIMAWHYATIEYKGRFVFNFNAPTISILNNVKIDYFSVLPGNWEELFNIIIKVWNNKDLEQTNNGIRYLGEVSSLLNMKPILVKSTLQHPRTAKWDQKFVLLLHASDILADFVNKYCKSATCGSLIIESIINVCTKFLNILRCGYGSMKIDTYDKRVERLGKNTASIVCFIMKYMSGANFLSACYGTSLLSE